MWSEGKSNCVYVYSVCIYYIMYISRYIYIYYIYTHVGARAHIHAEMHTCIETYSRAHIQTIIHTRIITHINTYTVFLPEMAMERGGRER